MKDLSKMSDAELLAEEARLSGIAYKSDAPRDPASMSDEELNAEYNRLSGLDSAGRQVVNEQHPAVSWKDRTLVKNFAGSGIEAMNYLKEKYPQLQWDIGDDGEPIAKGKNEKEWRKLDPSSLEWSDLTDIASDVVGGVAETAAGLAGAGAGAAAGAPTVVGAIPSAVAGGAAAAGAAGAGVEAAKEAIGQYFGMNTLDAGQIAKQGATSAAFSPLMGLGGGAKTAAKIASAGVKAEGKTVTKEAIQEYLTKNAKKMEYLNEGLGPTALSDAAKGAGNFLAGQTSGAGVKTFKDWFKYAEDTVDPATGQVTQKGLKNWTSEDLLGEVEKVRESIAGEVQKKQLDLSAQYDNLLTQSGVGVDVTDVKNIFENKIAWASNPKNMPIKQERDAMVKKLTSMRDNALVTHETPIPKYNDLGEEIGVDSVKEYATGAVPYSHSDAIVKNITNEMYPSVYQIQDVAEKKIAKQVNDIAHEIKKAMESNQSKALHAATGDGGVAKRLSEEWKVMAKQRDTINDLSDTGLFSQLKSLGIEGSGGSLKKHEISSLAEKLGVDITESVDKIRAFNHFNNPSAKPTSNVGTNMARVTVGAGAGAAYSLASGEPMGQNSFIGSILGPALLSPRVSKAMGTTGHNTVKKWRALKSAPAVAPVSKAVERASWNAIRNRANDEYQGE